MADTSTIETTTQATETPITLSEKAAGEVRKIMKQNEIPETYGLRVGVRGGGCSGLSYQLGFDADTREGDKVFDLDGIRLFVDSKSLFYLMGCQIDFTDGLNGRGFTFNNPNATRTCGCGESFGV